MIKWLNNALKIDKNVSMPNARESKHPHRDMEVGESVFYAGLISGSREYGNLNAYNHVYGKRNNCKFSMRKVKENGVDGIRLWRVK